MIVIDRPDKRRQPAPVALSGEDWQAGGGMADIIDGLHRDRHIPDRLLMAAGRLLWDMTRCHGSSAGLVMRMGDYVEAGGATDGGLPARFGADLDAFLRMERTLSRMRRHERELLAFLIRSNDRKMGGGLAEWGGRVSSYGTPKTARAAATGQVRAMLETVAELQGGGA